MNWEQFQKEAFELTKDEINVLTKQVIEQYKLAYEDISQQLQSQYAKLLSGVKPEDYYNEMIKFNRLEKLQAEIKISYDKYSKQAGLITENASFVGFSNTYYRMEYAASWLADFTIGIMPYSLAEFTVYGTKKSWDRITASIEKVYGNASLYKAKSGTLIQILTENRTRELNKIQNYITQGLLQGKSYNQMTAGIKDIIGSLMYKDGKYTASGAMANAMRIIRTETNRTMNAAQYANSKYLDSQGIEVKRRLVAVLDNRTRSQSARMDGQEVGVDEPFKYPNGATSMYPGNTGVPEYDINDREQVVEIIAGAEPELRRGRNPNTGENETFNYKNFDSWAKENGLKRNKYGELLFPENNK